MSEKLLSERYVADALMLLDLNQTRLLPALLSSNVKLITTPEIMSRLTQNDRQDIEEHCQKGRMAIETASAEDINGVFNEVETINRMSITDCLLCRMAKRMNVPLLLGCDYVRREAEQRGIRNKSLIWVFERLVNNGLLKPATAAKKLDDIQNRSPWVSKHVSFPQIEAWKSMSASEGELYLA